MARCWPMLWPQIAFCLAFAVGTTSSSHISFINFSDQVLVIYWLDSQGNEVPLETFEPFNEVGYETHTGDSFTYYLANDHVADDDDYAYYRTQVDIPDNNEKMVHLIDPKTFHVVCGSTEGDFGITVEPTWSPFGAARFLDLVYVHFYDGVALNRVVPRFLTQFGISPDYEFRTDYREWVIPDDDPYYHSDNYSDDPRVREKIPFRPGVMSFAGSGPNSRTAEVFVVMPGTTEHQMEFFGAENPWETPFGYVNETDLNSVVANWYGGYGDMPPWGSAPDPQLMYDLGGYEKYVKPNFPKLSYLTKCVISDFEVDDGQEYEGEEYADEDDEDDEDDEEDEL